MSFIDEIRELRDLGKITSQEGGELLADLSSEDLRDFATSDLIDLNIAERMNASENNRQEQNARAIASKLVKDRFPNGVPTPLSGIIEQAERVRNSALLRGDRGIQLPSDLYKASSLKNKETLGIDGPIASRPKSLVVGQTDFSKDKFDPMLDKSLGEQAKLIVRSGALTEIVGNSDKQQLYLQWLRNKGQADSQNNRHEFVNFAQEYYGGEVLRAVGASPVSDRNRSTPVLANKFAYDDQADIPMSLSTKGTDRLIENSVGLLAPDIDRSGDFRYMMNGSLRVGDNQAGAAEYPLKINILKQEYNPNTSESQNFSKFYQTAAENLVSQGITPTPDNVVGAMFPPEHRKVSAAKGIEGARGGKLLSALDTFSEQNRPLDRRFNRQSPSQYRYDDYLFTLSPESTRFDVERGFIPTDAILADNRKLNNMLGEELERRIVNQDSLKGYIPNPPVVLGSPNPKGRLISIDTPINDVVTRKAGVRLSQDPRGKQILRFGGR